VLCTFVWNLLKLTFFSEEDSDEESGAESESVGKKRQREDEEDEPDEPVDLDTLQDALIGKWFISNFTPGQI